MEQKREWSNNCNDDDDDTAAYDLALFDGPFCGKRNL